VSVIVRHGRRRRCSHRNGHGRTGARALRATGQTIAIAARGRFSKAPWLPLAASAPLQASLLLPPEAVQAAFAGLDQVSVTGTPAVTVWALVVRVIWNVPVPDRLTLEAEVPALMARVAGLAPGEPGSKHDADHAAAAHRHRGPAGVVCEYGCGLLLESVMLGIGSVTTPVLVTVTDIGALGLLTVWLPNVSVLADSV